MLGIFDDFAQEYAIVLMLKSLNVSGCNKVLLVKSRRLESLIFLLAALELIL